MLFHYSRWTKWQSIETRHDHPKHLNVEEHELRYIIHATRRCNCGLRFHSTKSAGFIIFTTYWSGLKNCKQNSNPYILTIILTQAVMVEEHLDIYCRLLILSEFRKPSPVHGSSSIDHNHFKPIATS